MFNLILEIIVLIVFFILGTIGKLGAGIESELHSLWGQDIGNILCGIGVTWGVASFLGLHKNIVEKAISLISATIVFLFGYYLTTNGVFSALCAIGWFCLVIAWFLCYGNPPLSRIFTICGLSLIIIFSQFKEYDKPTAPPPVPYKIPDDAAIWTEF